MSDANKWTRELLLKGNPRGGYTLAGAPKLPNVITILANHPAWRGVIAWDDFALRMIFAKTPNYHANDRASVDIRPGDRVTDDDYTRIASWFARTDIEIDPDTGSESNLSVGTSTIEQAAIVVAKKNPIHPPRNYLDALKWDGKPRLSRWLSEYLGTPDNDYTRSVGAWWLISAVARIFKPGCQADHVLTLEGPQGEGKSTALRTLATPWFTDEIADLSTKDALMQMHGVWIVEFAEFDTLSRAEAARSKAFITARIDRFRLPYSSTVEEFPRSSVCAATVNGSAYLKDDTGNRRFWPVACTQEHPIAQAQIERDRDQLLAEAVHQFKAGAPWWPHDPSLRDFLGSEQRDRMAEDDWETPIAHWLLATFGWGKKPCSKCNACKTDVGLCVELEDCRYYFERVSLERPDPARKFKPCGQCLGCLEADGVTTFEVLNGALKIEPSKIDRSAQTRAGSCLLRFGFFKHRAAREGRRLWVYIAPPRTVHLPRSSTGPPECAQAAQ
jgi:hypothetical protein